MAKTGRPLLVGIVIAGLTLAPRWTEAHSGEQEATAHVRSTNAQIVALIAVATQQSPTFRGLVDAIDRTDAFVYVENVRCTSGRIACLGPLTSAGGYRFLRVHVKVQGRADWDAMSSIGHELRHAVEVFGNRRVTTDGELRYFYAHEGAEGGILHPFETEAARKAGNDVRREVQDYRRKSAKPE